MFFDLEEIIFENFKKIENNIINVELAKVLGYQVDMKHIKCPFQWLAKHETMFHIVDFLLVKSLELLDHKWKSFFSFFDQNFY
jgi:hypothetical protein